MKNLFFVGAVSSILTALIAGGIVYFVLSNSHLEKQNQLNEQKIGLQNQIDELKKQSEATQLPTVIEPDQADSADTVQTFTNNPAVTSCDFWKERAFGKVLVDTGDNVAGTLTLKGRIIERVEDVGRGMTERKITAVYLVFSDPVNTSQRVFYDYYLAMAREGNMINRADGQQLLFKLGVRSGSELATTADISNELKNRIMSSIGKTDAMQLKLTIPIPHGYGGRARDSFSFACIISE